MSLDDYLRKFEILKNSCESYGTVIPDDILAYNMLECSNLSSERKELVRATLTDLKTSEMREKLRRIFPETIEQNAVSTSHTETLSVKQEPVFHGTDNCNCEESVMYNNQQYSRRGRGNNRRGGRRQNRNDKNYNKPNNSSLKMNPVDSNGLVMTCDFCRSVYHFIKACPDHKQQNAGSGGYDAPHNSNRYL